MPVASMILGAAALYLGTGAVIAVVFIVAGIPRAMPDAGRVTLGARLLLLPGCALLWPAVLRRWIARP